MKDKLEKLIRAMKEEQMTPDEKARVYLRVSASTVSPSSYIYSPYFSKFSFPVLVRVAGVLLLILTVTTAGLSYASASALPGEFLYAVKTNFKEQLEEKLAGTPEKRIALRQQRLEVRFSEVETLIKEKKITPENRSIAETKIQETKEAIVSDLEVINKENPAATIEAKADLETNIQEHQEKLDVLIEESNTEAETPAPTDPTTTPAPETETPDEGTTTPPPSEVSKDDPSTPIDESLIENVKVTPEGGSVVGGGSALPADKIDQAGAKS